MNLLPVGSDQVYSSASPGARKVFRSFLLQRGVVQSLQNIPHIVGTCNQPPYSMIQHIIIVDMQVCALPLQSIMFFSLKMVVMTQPTVR